MRIGVLLVSRRIGAIACAGALLAGCGARSTSMLPQLSPNANASQRRASVAPAERANLTGALTITIKIPAATGADPRFVSPSSKSAKLVFKGPQASTVIAALTASTKGCVKASGVTTCTLSETLKAGTYAAAVTTYSLVPVNGKIPAAAKVLSTASDLPVTVKHGSPNEFKVSLNGVVASLDFTVPSATIGTAFATPAPLKVVARDPGGNVITGTYENAISISDDDNSGHTSVATSGPDHPPAGKLISSSDSAKLSYDGDSSLLQAVISVTAQGASKQSHTFDPVPKITSISVSSGSIGQAIDETIIGKFAPSHTLVNAPGMLVVPGTLAATATKITVTLMIDPHTASAGTADVTANTYDSGPSNAKPFTISNTNVDIVTVGTDTAASDVNGVIGNGAGAQGDLRYAMLHAGAGDTIVFDTVSMCNATDGNGACTITLSGPLPPIVQNQTIDGGFYHSSPRIAIDGNGKYRAFWVDASTVAIDNLEILNVKAQGGAGGVGTGGGGGGAGLGAGIFMHQGTVSVTNVFFSACVAAGGAGGAPLGNTVGSGGGGGGLAGTGGSTANGGNPQNVGGGGGGGVLADGGSDAFQGADGGFGGGGGGAYTNNAGTPTGSGGAGGAAYAGGSTGSAGGGDGGAGAYGGGAGGGGYGFNATAGNGGAGGFGAGGGGGGGTAGGTAGRGGDAGQGGGGGGGNLGAGSGQSLGTLFGGNGSSGGTSFTGGGGGVGAGPAIFGAGSILITTNSGAANCSATGGAAGGTGAGAGDADSTPVFVAGGFVNGDSSQGPAPSALGSTPPAARPRSARPKAHRPH